MDPSQTDYPPMKNLTIENITDNVNLINSGCHDPRFKYLIERLVVHLHDYTRETRLSMGEWNTAIEFLTKCGQMCTDTRQEFILLSDVLGLSLLVDAIDHPKHADATEGTILGPFHTHDAHTMKNGENIDSDPDGIPLLIVCILRDREGNPVEGAKMDVWEVDSKGFYDVQYSERDGPHGRAVLRSDKQGRVWFKGIVPVSYPVPTDGPVGDLLRRLRRHPYRPAHIHFMIEKEGYDHYITALTLRGDPYEYHDPVFGVKESLVVDLSEVKDRKVAEEYGVLVGTKYLEHTFILETDSEAEELRKEHAIEVMGDSIEFHDKMPVPVTQNSS